MATTEPVSERLADGYPVHKHAGNVKVEDLTITCGTSMSRQFYDWLVTSIEYQHERKEGAVITTNYDFKEVVRQDFYQALLSEIGLPGVDATSKDSCKFTIKIAPEYTELKYSGGTRSILPTPTSEEKQKRWQAANFRMSIDGMESHCKKITKVEAITIKQNIIDNSIGERLIFQKEPAQIDFPNLIMSVPESDAQAWYDWYDAFVCKGNSAPDKEKSGQLEYLTTDVRGALFTVQFFNLGIIKFTPDKLDSTSDKLRYVKLEMYCEKMDFKYSPEGCAA